MHLMKLSFFEAVLKAYPISMRNWQNKNLDFNLFSKLYTYAQAYLSDNFHSPHFPSL